MSLSIQCTDVQYLALLYTLYCTYSTLRDGMEVCLGSAIMNNCFLYFVLLWREWTRMRWERRPNLTKVSRKKLRLRISNIVPCRVAVNKIIYKNTSFIQTLYY